MPDFDPTELFETTYDTDSFNSQYTPFPETECYARIKRVSAHKAVVDGNERIVADFTFVTDDDDIIAETGMQEPSVVYNVWLDTRPGTMQLIDKSENKNANVKLRQLAEAVGLKKGKKFRLSDLEGLGCYIRTRQNRDRDDPEITRTNVVRVAAESSI